MNTRSAEQVYIQVGYWIILLSVLIFLCTRAYSEILHEVQPGETLSEIAQKYYDDPSQWVVISNANRDKLRHNGALLLPYTLLVIPDPGIRQSIETNDNVPASVTVQYLATGDDFAPFVSLSLPENGMLTELVRTAYSRIGVPFEIDFLPWADGYDRTLAGRYTATFPYFFTTARRDRFLYSDPIFEINFAMFTKVGSTVDFDNLKPDTKFCKPLGYISQLDPEFQDLVEVVEPNNMVACFDMLHDGDVDFVIDSELSGRRIVIQRNYEGSIEFSQNPISVQGLHVMFPRSSQESISQRFKFNTAIAEMKADGSLKEIVDRHIRNYLSAP